jgi:hypothetical protein
VEEVYVDTISQNPYFEPFAPETAKIHEESHELNLIQFSIYTIPTQVGLYV